MATYYGTYGQKVQYLASDPSDPQTGQVWYNSTSAVLKVRGFSIGAWSSGGNMGTARYAVGAAGIQTAALAFGGQPVPGRSAATEAYNGTSWTAQNTMAGSRIVNVGAGTQTAAIAAGGSGNPPGNPFNYVAITELFNGTSWSTPPATINTLRRSAAGGGTQTSLVMFGGTNNATSPNFSAATEKYNGTSWTSVNSMNTARNYLAGCGIQTAALAICGNDSTPAVTAFVESYDGTTWTTITSVNTAGLTRNATGTSTSALVFGGQPGPGPGPRTGATELWNGTSWTSNPTGLSTARGLSGSNVGTQTSSLSSGGATAASTTTTATEEWNGATPTTRTVTVS